MTVFGDRAFREIKLNEVIRVGPWSNGIGIPVRRGRDIRRKAMWEHNKKATFYKPGSEVSQETNADSTLILDFHPPERWENRFLLFKLSSLWYLVIAAWADWYTYKIKIDSTSKKFLATESSCLSLAYSQTLNIDPLILISLSSIQ